MRDVAKTGRSDLLFVSWDYGEGEERVNYTQILRTDTSDFVTAPKDDAPGVKNSDLKPGDYYLCASALMPGFNINLIENPYQGDERIESVDASIEYGNEGITTDTGNYADIKTMLTSIR
jgi:hypothetical protein